MSSKRPSAVAEFLKSTPHSEEIVTVPVGLLPPDHRARLSLGVHHLNVQGRWLHEVWTERAA